MIARLLAAACVLALAVPAHAQQFPSRPVKIVAPFAAGGSADLIPRIVGERLSAMWGQPVIVENRPGAGGNIAAEYVYRAEPDGYTLLSSPPSTLIINQYLYANLAYDQSHWVPVSVMVAVPNVLLVNPKAAAKSGQELIAYARANPDKLNYSSQGSGPPSPLTAELCKTFSGARTPPIPHTPTTPPPT